MFMTGNAVQLVWVTMPFVAIAVGVATFWAMEGKRLEVPPRAS